MTRVRRKNSTRQGSIVGELPNGDVWVEWDDDPQQRWQITPNLLTDYDRRPTELALLDALDRLRDSFNLAIECAIRDIQREMKK